MQNVFGAIDTSKTEKSATEGMRRIAKNSITILSYIPAALNKMFSSEFWSLLAKILWNELKQIIYSLGFYVSEELREELKGLNEEMRVLLEGRSPEASKRS